MEITYSKMANFQAKICVFLFLTILCNEVLALGHRGCTLAEMAEENVKKLAVANNELALKLYQRLTAVTKENVFFSPLSLSTVFGMLFYGTKGVTEQELRTTLGYEAANLPSELVHSSFNHFLTEILPASYQDNSPYTLNIANAVLLDKKLDLMPTYKSEVQSLYLATVQDVDFARQSESIKNEINTWVKVKTNGKIDNLFDDLSPSAIMVLLNAVYFKGTWKTQFEQEKTYPEKFYNDGLEAGAKTVPLMHLKSSFPYTEVYDLQALELPYKGENLSMIVLLPNQRDGLADLERSLTTETIQNIRKQLYSTKVIVSLPKFKIQYSSELSPAFQSLGARSIFQAGSADFSRMTPSKDVFVSQIVHKAVVEVNEEGSEAAAVTGIVSNRMRPMLDTTPEFTADHPFMFAIVDRRSDMVLFVGRVNKL